MSNWFIYLKRTGCLLLWENVASYFELQTEITDDFPLHHTNLSSISERSFFSPFKKVLLLSVLSQRNCFHEWQQVIPIDNISPSSRLHRVSAAFWRQPAADCGGPLGFDCLQGGACHPQLQGRGPPHPQHWMVQRWWTCGDRQRWPAFSPHAPAQRLPFLLAHRARPTEQTRRGRLHLCGPQLPGRGH